MGFPTGIDVKLDRAKLHIAELDVELRTLESRCRGAVQRRRDRETHEVVFFLKGLPEIEPRLSAILGDAVHNLRSVLDHLADALVRRYGGTPNDGTSFPIRDKPLPSGDPPGIKGIGSLPKDVRDLLDAVQPYKRNAPRLHELHILNKLDITDKHSELLLGVFYTQGTAWFGEHIDITGFNQGPHQDGDELGRWKLRTGGLHDSEFKPMFKFHVGLDHPAMGPFAASYNVATWLRKQALFFVEERVLDCFAPYVL